MNYGRGTANYLSETVILAMHRTEWLIMAKVTIVFAVLLIILGLVSFFGTGSVHHTALIPTWFGVALGIGGALAISPSETPAQNLYAHQRHDRRSGLHRGTC
jgi:hypothetical protein